MYGLKPGVVPPLGCFWFLVVVLFLQLRDQGFVSRDLGGSWLAG